jgi:regulatory protein
VVVPVLVAPVTVQGIAEHPRVAGRYRVRCRGRVVDDASGSAEGADEVSESPGASRRDAPVPPGVVEVVLVLTASGIGELGVHAGRVLDDASWGALQREARVVAAQDAALRSLATGRRSERDLAMRVRRREPDAAIVAEAVARLRALGVVDDASFAEAEAAARLRRGTVATGQVRRELRRRGVASDVAEEAIAAASVDLEVDDAARCREAAAKRARQLRGLDALTARRRLTAWLMRRGFAPGVVIPTVRAVLAVGGAADDDGDGVDDDAMAGDDEG